MTKIEQSQAAHKDGIFETLKFAERKSDYYEAMDGILSLGHTMEDYLHYFPAFVGHVTLWRYFTLYELYKKTMGIAGHIADVGVYKGASALLFSKLVQIFEPESLTLVHGFDWFKGTQASEEDSLQMTGAYCESEKRLRDLVTLQKLDNVLKIHCLDIANDIDSFFDRYPYMRFKLVFLDSGTYDVVSSAIKAFWPRLTPGGLLVFDQFNHEVAPGETRAVAELLPNEKVETLPNSWMPNAYIQKPWSR
jgi:Methyltransferase domain